MSVKTLLLTGLLALCFSVPAQARPTLLPSYGLVGLNVWNSLDHEDRAPAVAIEYHPSLNIGLGLRPFLGLNLTSHASVWAGAGLERDFFLSPSFVLTPSLGAGYYAKGSSDMDLDYPLEFRSQLSAAYVFGSGNRLGMNITHMSNAGLGDRNPGTEMVGVFWTMPLR